MVVEAVVVSVTELDEEEGVVIEDVDAFEVIVVELEDVVSTIEDFVDDRVEVSVDVVDATVDDVDADEVGSDDVKGNVASDVVGLTVDVVVGSIFSAEQSIDR